MDNFLKKAGIILVMILAAALSQGAKTHGQNLSGSVVLDSPELTVVAKDGAYHLEWQDVPGAYFHVYKYKHESYDQWGWEEILRTNQRTAQFGNFCGQQTFLVIAKVGSGSSDVLRSSPVSATSPCGWANPSQIQLNAGSSTTASAEISWTSIPGSQYYAVYWLDEMGMSTNFMTTTATSLNIPLDCGESRHVQIYSVGVQGLPRWASNPARVQTLSCPTSSVPVLTETFELKIGSNQRYEQEELVWVSYPGASAYEVWVKNHPNGEYKLIDWVNSFASRYKVHTSCGTEITARIVALNDKDEVVATSNSVSKETLPCVEVPKLSVLRTLDSTFLTWKKDPNVTWYYVVKVHQDGSLETLRIQQAASFRISMLCSQSLRVWVIPYIHGKRTEFGEARMNPVCGIRYFPLVNNASGQ